MYFISCAENVISLKDTLMDNYFISREIINSSINFLKIIILKLKKKKFLNFLLLKKRVWYYISFYRKLFWLLLHPHQRAFMMLFFHTLNRSSVIHPYKKLEISWQAALSAKLFRKLDTIFVRACTLVRLHSGALGAWCKRIYDCFCT